MTSFIPTKTLYGVIENNCVRFRNHQICEFGQLWRLPEGEQFKIGSFSWSYIIRCLKYHFWLLLSWSKHSMIKSEISLSIRFILSLNFLNLEIFGDFCRQNDASWNKNKSCKKWYFKQLISSWYIFNNEPNSPSLNSSV